MNEDNIKQIKQFGLMMLVYFIILIGIVIYIYIYIYIYTNIHYKNTSSPVEEMCHRQLIVTLDSILDARFGSGCCEEDIDTDNVTIIKGRFNGFLAPME